MMARRTAALKPSDKCIPTRLPLKPTVTPLNERKPSADMLKSPMMRPRIGAGALSCTSSLSVVRDNIFMGFVTPLYQCDDNGGNVVVLPPA